MADESPVNQRVAVIDADLERWRDRRARAAQRLDFIDEQIRQLEAARDVELAPESALAEPGPGVRDDAEPPSSEG